MFIAEGRREQRWELKHRWCRKRLDEMRACREAAQRKLAPASIRTEAMGAGLQTGVKGVWHRLIDNVSRREALSMVPKTMAECLFRRSWTVHYGGGAPISALIPMRK